VAKTSKSATYAEDVPGVNAPTLPDPDLELQSGVVNSAHPDYEETKRKEK
jgi:polyphosphate kinase 2 (PPK2 family)